MEETLEDGVYAVQGTMYKPDLKTKSMADSAFSHTMPMTVQDGKATLRMNFKAMEITGLNGYLGRLKYYGSGYQKDAYGAPTGTLKDVTVKSVQKYSDGAVISDDFGTDYPDLRHSPWTKRLCLRGLKPRMRKPHVPMSHILRKRWAD